MTATTYQWQVNIGSGFVNATGTGNTTATYTSRAEGDEGGTLRVNVTFTDNGNPGNPESATSNTSNAVADSADLVDTLDTTSVTQGTPVHVTVSDGGDTVTHHDLSVAGQHRLVASSMPPAPATQPPPTRRPKATRAARCG